MTRPPDDLDFPVLMLAAAPAEPSVSQYGGGPFGGLSRVGLAYGDDDELQLLTTARRGRRFGAAGPQWAAEDLPVLAGEAVRDLLLATIRPGGLASDQVGRLVEEHHATADRFAQSFPGGPWQARPAPVDGVPFALWTVTLPDVGFAAALDLGPVVLTARGRDAEAWDWRFTAAAPDVVRPLLAAADET